MDCLQWPPSPLSFLQSSPEVTNPYVIDLTVSVAIPIEAHIESSRPWISNGQHLSIETSPTDLR